MAITEYKQLEYLESTGTQYIDTGIEVGEFMPSIRIKFRSTNYGVGYIGVHNNGSRQLYISKKDENTVTLLDYQRNITEVSIQQVLEWDEVFVDRITKTLTVNGMTYPINGSFSWVMSNPTNIALFGVMVYSKGVAKCSKVSIAYCEMYDQNMNLIRNFIPCVRKSDNVVGMYDLVTEAFFENQGTGEFLYGFLPEVPETPTEAISITYGGETIATLEAGQTATFICEGEKMASDIVVEFDTAGTITYNGNKTAVQAGQTATLVCDGKKAVTDIVIMAIASEEPTYESNFTLADGSVLITADGKVFMASEVGEEMVMITGIWQFPETIDVATFPNKKIMVNFKSGENNNTDFNCMFVEDGMLYYGDYEMAYFQSWYTNEHMRVDFGDTEQSVPKSFYDWLIANATAGGDTATLITFTIDGVEYQAEEGMTYWEWCESEYNVDGYMGNGLNPGGFMYIVGMDNDTVLIDGATYTLAPLGGFD